MGAALPGDASSQSALPPLHSTRDVLIDVVLQLLLSGPLCKVAGDILVNGNPKIRLAILTTCDRCHALLRIGPSYRYGTTRVSLDTFCWGWVHVE